MAVVWFGLKKDRRRSHLRPEMPVARRSHSKVIVGTCLAWTDKSGRLSDGQSYLCSKAQRCLKNCCDCDHCWGWWTAFGSPSARSRNFAASLGMVLIGRGMTGSRGAREVALAGKDLGRVVIWKSWRNVMNYNGREKCRMNWRRLMCVSVLDGLMVGGCYW